MAFNNPSMLWPELERHLSGSLPGRSLPPERPSPAQPTRRRGSVPYAELHCHTNFSFLDGASHPEEMVETAVRLGLEALAITDHDGLYGVVRFAEAAREVGLPTVFGAELTLDDSGTPRPGVPDPRGHHLVVLARDPSGYARLSTVISGAQVEGGEKGVPRLTLDRLAEAHAGHWLVLTGCRKGAVPSALVRDGPSAGARALGGLIASFGRENVAVELWDEGDPLDSVRNDGLAALAARLGVEVVATGNAHYHLPSRRRLATALAAVRARRSLDDLDRWLPAGAGAHLRSGAEQARRFARYPGAVERAAELGLACAFDLGLVAPRLPPFPCPDGLDEMGYLRRLVADGATVRYGPRDAERVDGAWAQIDHELEVIERLGFPGYFLVVWDIVEFCRRSNIFCQGRGSAANSAVCYAIGITKADAVSLGLLFERFLSPERDGPPDIDLDIESDRREEAIQYVYARYGRDNAAQVANVITYRPRSAVRDMARALGFAPGQQDAWSKLIDPWNPVRAEVRADDRVTAESARNATTDGIPSSVMDLAAQVQHFPRHLGIHSGGMVICDRPVVEVCPVEWGRMPGRTVLQWDKDDCAAVGLVKFDLLGLGMLSAIHYAVDLVRETHGVEIDLATIPQEDTVYEQLSRGDSVGVFQVESRAQMATLPRLKPRVFYDLVVEVALIRPGPIQGGSVHPYIRRRNGQEPVTYLHPLLERSLGKTLGVPLFQEQLMQMAIDVADFTPAEADQLRQAMGSKRSTERMARLRDRLYAGMESKGITGDVADLIWDKLAAFSSFGFPESHSVSFAYLVYSSAWIRHWWPAAFCAALLNAQPMGFWSPQSLVGDARRHGVVVRGPDVNASDAKASLEPCEESAGGVAVRLGVCAVRNVGDDLARRIAEGRPYLTLEDFVRRAGAPVAAVEALATAGALGCLDGRTPTHETPTDETKMGRREAMWAAGALARTGPDRLEGIVTGVEAPRLPGMTEVEITAADMWATGISPEGHPVRHVRDLLDRLGVLAAVALAGVDHGSRVLVAGVVTHRQRPATASDTTFLNLEDETGLVNVIVSKGCWMRHRRVAQTAPALVIRGTLERNEGVVNVIAERIEPLRVTGIVRSRDFR